MRVGLKIILKVAATCRQVTPPPPLPLPPSPSLQAWRPGVINELARPIGDGIQSLWMVGQPIVYTNIYTLSGPLHPEHSLIQTVSQNGAAHSLSASITAEQPARRALPAFRLSKDFTAAAANYYYATASPIHTGSDPAPASLHAGLG